MQKTLITAALLAAVLPAPVLAASEPVPRVDVYYGDLDLARPADIKRLDRRLARAVNSLCPSTDGLREMALLRAAKRCRAERHAGIAAARQAALARADKPAFATAP